MKYVRIVILLAVLIGGLLIAALNTDAATLNLVFWSFQTSVGILLIFALLLGLLIGGGLVMAAVVLPMYAKLRRAGKSLPLATAPVTPTSPTSQPVSPHTFDGR